MIRITTQARFPVEPPYLGEGPDVVVYADGTVYTAFTGNFVAQPMIWPFHAGAIDQAQLDELLQFAIDRELLTEPADYRPRTDIADAGQTTIVLRDAGVEVVHRVQEFSITPTEHSAEYVGALREFAGRVHAATEAVYESSGGDFYQPDALAVLAAPGEPRSGQPAPVDWPGGVALADLADCMIVDEPSVLGELRGQHAGQTYAQDGVTYRIAVRVAFPGETTC